MKHTFTLGVLVLLLTSGLSTGRAAEKSPQAVLDLAQATLVQLGTDPIIVKAVKAENAKGKTLDHIKTIDEQWKATPGIVDYMQALMDSECGQHLRDFQKTAPYYAEIFVTDHQGANVALTDKTSDYWQGDEAKFIECYKGGAGAIYLGEVAFDESTQTYLVQVSVPVKDEGQVIGVIVIGVDLDRLEQAK